MKEPITPRAASSAPPEMPRLIRFKVAAFAVLVMIAGVPGLRTIQNYRESLVASMQGGDVTAEVLDRRIPKQFGNYRLNATSQEQDKGEPVLEDAVYTTDAASSITVGIWISPREHSVHWSRMAHGDSPEMRADRSFMTAQNRLVSFDTAYYTNGITDSLEGDTYCSPSICRLSQESANGFHLGFVNVMDFNTRGERFIPIFFRVERRHTDAPKADPYKELLAESQSFLAGVDLPELSKRFQ